MVDRATSERQASGPVKDLNVTVRFQRSPATIGPGAGDGARGGVVGIADGLRLLLQAASDDGRSAIPDHLDAGRRDPDDRCRLELDHGVEEITSTIRYG